MRAAPQATKDIFFILPKIIFIEIAYLAAFLTYFAENEQ
jgi:hypothetical protein